RLAVLEDAQMVFRWRNDPFILTRGSSQSQVPRDEHLKWFNETVQGSVRKMFIILISDEEAIGQVRFDRISDEEATVSIYLLQAFTGKGYGVEVIRLACREIFKLWNIQNVVACVRSDNPYARAAFLKAEFSDNSERRCCPDAHFELVLSSKASVPDDS